MIVQYAYVTWSRPNLSPAEEVDFGKEVAQNGKDMYLAAFRTALWKPRSQSNSTGTTSSSTTKPSATFSFGYKIGRAIAAWPRPIRYLLLAAVLGLFACPIIEDEQLRVRFLGVLVIVYSIYLFSIQLAVYRYSRWLDYLLLRYAATVVKKDG